MSGSFGAGGAGDGWGYGFATSIAAISLNHPTVEPTTKITYSVKLDLTAAEATLESRDGGHSFVVFWVAAHHDGCAATECWYFEQLTVASDRDSVAGPNSKKRLSSGRAASSVDG